MVKLYVGDLDEGQTFYSDVFGAKLALAVGAGAHIMTFPNGGPGLALIKAGAGDKNKKGELMPDGIAEEYLRFNPPKNT